MFLSHDMAHIATRFSAFCSMIWPILLCDGAQISKEMQATREKGVYLFAEKYILFAQKVHTFFHRKYMPFIQRIYRFLKRYYGLMEKVLSFCTKSTIVLPKKYYRFLREGLSRCNRLTVS